MPEENKVVFISDRVSISGPRVTDRSMKVTFEAGEYQTTNISELLKLPTDRTLKVTVEVGE